MVNVIKSLLDVNQHHTSHYEWNASIKLKSLRALYQRLSNILFYKNIHVFFQTSKKKRKIKKVQFDETPFHNWLLLSNQKKDKCQSIPLNWFIIFDLNKGHEIAHLFATVLEIKRKGRVKSLAPLLGSSVMGNSRVPTGLWLQKWGCTAPHEAINNHA